MPDAENDALTEAVRFYLAAYLLPANVAAYYAPGDDHRTVAARCAPLLVEHIASVIPSGKGDTNG